MVGEYQVLHIWIIKKYLLMKSYKFFHISEIVRTALNNGRLYQAMKIHVKRDLDR